MKTLYFDCFSGVSGDMTVGALLDLGADFDALRAGLDSLGVPGYRVAAERVVKKGVSATQFRVLIEPDTDKPHRHLRHVVEIIRRGDLPETVKERSIAVFARIAEVEAAIHGTTVERVHFHEVGAIDSIVDVVGAHLALHLLGVGRVVVSPIQVGCGTIQCAHGVMPVPAPATAALLRGAPACGGGVEGELATPTGAALMTAWAESFGPMPAMTVEGVGYGAGTKDLPDRANVLRAVLGEADAAAGAAGGDASGETVTVIETLLDDMSGEMLAPAMEALLAAGARDAFITPAFGKKGRPAQLLTVLCDAGQVSGIVRCLFAHTTTLGVRMRGERRVTLARSWKTVETPQGRVRVKVAEFEGAPSTAHPEFEDCRVRAEAAGVPVRRVIEAAQAAAQRGEWCDEE